MKLVGFTVKNYRSITTTERLPIDDITILVGPNNEGKSNILRALVTGLRIASEGNVLVSTRTVRGARSAYYDRRSESYDWERDFPLSLQASAPSGKSLFRLEFELNGSDRSAFSKLVGSNLTANLTLELTLDKKDVEFDVKLQGPAKTKIAAKRVEIAKFISERLDFEYIGTNRTAERSEEMIERLVEKELFGLRSNPAYAEALKKIEDLEKPIVSSVAAKLGPALKEFLPGIKSVTIRQRPGFVPRSTRGLDVLVDDGTPTPLARKGDGVQSLAAVALIRDTKRTSRSGTNLILAVEEPESHLHPDAVHELRRVLLDISKSHQVIVTTHSPILADREKPSRNIIVQKSQATPANTIKEVRDALGVHVSDNLVGASLVLLVEGPDDKRIVEAFLREQGSRIRHAVADGELVVESIEGAGNLTHRATMHKSNLCNVHALIDSDKSGKSAIANALKVKAISEVELAEITAPGLSEAEIEDLVDPARYLPRFKERFNVEINSGEILKGKTKWSDRMFLLFKKKGKEWERCASEAKTVVADAVVENTDGAFIETRRGVLDSLAKSLESRLAELTVNRVKQKSGKKIKVRRTPEPRLRPPPPPTAVAPSPPAGTAEQPISDAGPELTPTVTADVGFQPKA